MPTIESDQRRSFAERVLDNTRSVLEGANVQYNLNGEVIDLTRLLDDAVIADMDDEGIVSIPDEVAQTDALAIVALARNETLTVGQGFDVQSPSQRIKSLDTFKKWGLDDDAANDFLATFDRDFKGTRGTVRKRIGPYSDATTFAVATAFNLQRAKEMRGLSDAPGASIGKTAARYLVIVNYDKSNFPTPQLVTHEVAHFAENTANPITTMSSQRAVDMRKLRDELKAYNAGAQSARHIIRTSPLSETEIKRQMNTDAQLYIDYIRGQVNQGDTDQFRTTPAMLERLEQEGFTIDDIMHGRINFDELSRTLGIV